ncbi:MAG: transposase, partial [Candidatus Electrothrix sp. GM3_4]|nr:transposase [Candidatus Electrothrix sp. GM3_4]
MTRQVGLHLISKLRCDSALYLKWKGVYSGRGARKIYGDKIDYQNLPSSCLKDEKTEGYIRTRTYQFEARHKRFADTLNVVIISKTSNLTSKNARVVLFSSDLELEWKHIIDYYRLRFQIEFNFRDAKQHWGLEDFMVIKKQAVF